VRAGVDVAGGGRTRRGALETWRGALETWRAGTRPGGRRGGRADAGVALLRSVLSPPLTSHTTRTSTTAEFQGKVGVVGLGIMGAPMASNLIRAG